MKENKTLEAYLNQGYWVFNVKTGQDAISLLQSDNFTSEVELDSDMPNKIAIVFLHHPDKESLAIVTEKEEEIELAKEEKRKELEPVGLLIKVYVSAQGTRESTETTGDITNFTDHAQSLNGWSLKEEDTRWRFSAKKEINSINKSDAREEVESFRTKLALVGLKSNIGLQIVHTSISKLTKNHRTFSTKGFYKNVQLSEAQDIHNNELRKILIKLNEARSEQSPIRKIERLWAILEIIFENNHGDRLLSEDEIDQSISCIEQKTKLEDGKINEIKSIIANRKQKGRNERIAANASPYTDESQPEVKDKIKEIAKVRGKYSHGESPNYNEDKIDSLVSFSYDVILQYLEQEFEIDH